MSTPTWEEIATVAEKFRREIGGVYGYVAAAIEHDHRELRP
ncbi:hypothetical protein [Glaciibacter psychrotolerans]|uniref:Uncharacterized protein n=1 Tax=Glaciibacter psychrotolerans TaxID=670054 RepID=A0A7Z0EDY3_9MICO|nr:hypothetical protein [Leifsonia psychrotolerans]NYJ19169.1 hypothetical protein [Leifsonia psychrotolerans]